MACCLDAHQVDGFVCEVEMRSVADVTSITVVAIPGGTTLPHHWVRPEIGVSTFACTGRPDEIALSAHPSKLGCAASYNSHESVLLAH